MKKWRQRASSIVGTTLSQQETKTLETKTLETENTDTENIEIKKNWRQKLFSQRKRIDKQVWKRVNFIGRLFGKNEPPTMGEIIMYLFGILIILTVAFLYVLGLFFEMGDWLGSIVETVTFVVNGFSQVFFRSISQR